MAYNIKDVFYLSTSATISANTSGVGSSQLDLSAYIDPIARGRTKGTGLAVYKIHFSILEDSGRPVRPADTGVFTVSMQAGLGVGDNATGTAFAMDSSVLGNTNALNVATAAYYSPGASANMNGFYDFVMPSKDVPYVIVRDNACLVYEIGDVVASGTGDLTLSARLECAQIGLDQATLNQLLRTQTV
tara:strand:- start:9 stop:572 length:564 start_codon:yes stop_codon:yes gene_type:complete